jgi:hypothetical protein
MQLRCGSRGERRCCVFAQTSREISRSKGSVRHLDGIPTSELRRARASDRPLFRVHSLTPSSRSLFRRRPIAGAFDATALFMWSSNVLRLRKCSSAGVLRHGIKPRWYSSARSLPVSQEEFAGVLRGILPELWGVEGNAPLGMWYPAPT